MKKKKKLRGILGRKKAMRARHGKQTCFFFWPKTPARFKSLILELFFAV